MEDDDFVGRGGLNDDVALPKATVNKFANDLAASLDFRLTNETRELLAECCTEFVHLLSSEANDVCEKESKKTITPEHVLKAMKELGLSQYYEEVAEEYERHKDSEKHVKSKGGAWARLAGSGMTQEDLLRQQEKLFQMARTDPLAAMTHSNQPAGGGAEAAPGGGGEAAANPPSSARSSAAAAAKPGGGGAAATATADDDDEDYDDDNDDENDDNDEDYDD